MLGGMKATVLAAATLVATLLLFAPAAPGPEASRPAGSLSATRGWSWPLSPVPEVTRPFDPPAQKWLSGHRGADLAARPGVAVFAPAGGIISFAGVVVDRPVLVIDHGAGLRSSFEPVRTDFVPGQIVAAGDEIGMVGTGSHCASRCLHWGLRLGETYIDPLLTIFDDRPSILLPRQ